MSRPRAVLWMEVDDWKQQLKSGATPEPGFCLQKVATDIQAKEVEGAARTIRFTVSRNSVDRDNDTINQEGWNLSSFLKNPVVPFAHDYRSLPVAKAVNTMVMNGDLVSSAEFPTREIYPFADTVYQMVKGGFLNAVSVGFRPKAHEFNKDRGGVDFLEQELLEYSIVPVPANPEALVQARSMGIDVKPLKQWAERTLDEWHEEKGIWLPASVLEAAVKELKGASVPVQTTVTDTTTPTMIARTGGTTVGLSNGAMTAETASHDHTAETAEGTATPAKETSTPEDVKEPTVKEEAPAAEASNPAPQDVKDVIDEQGATAPVQEKDVPSDDDEPFANPFTDKTFDQAVEDTDEVALELDWTSEEMEQLKDPQEDWAIEWDDEPDATPVTKGVGSTEVQSLAAALAAAKTSEEGTVAKINPVVLQSPLPGSYEAIAQQLGDQASNFLTANGKEFRAEMDRAVIVATFADSAIVCVIGGDRPWEDDPCYKASYQRAEELGGMARWFGEPTKVDIRISADIIQQTASTRVWGPQGTEKTAGPAVTDEVVKTSDVEQVDLLKAMSEALGNIGLQEIVQSATTRAIRRQQGRVD